MQHHKNIRKFWVISSEGLDVTTDYVFLGKRVTEDKKV